MKKFIPVFVVTLAVVLFFNGKKYDELVSSRLSSSIAVCLEGQSCGQATAMNVAAGGAERSAESIYSSGCAACHDAGVCLLYTSPSPRDISGSRMPSSA